MRSHTSLSSAASPTPCLQSNNLRGAALITDFEDQAADLIDFKSTKGVPSKVQKELKKAKKNGVDKKEVKSLQKKILKKWNKNTKKRCSMYLSEPTCDGAKNCEWSNDTCVSSKFFEDEEEEFFFDSSEDLFDSEDYDFDEDSEDYDFMTKSLSKKVDKAVDKKLEKKGLTRDDLDKKELKKVVKKVENKIQDKVDKEDAKKLLKKQNACLIIHSETVCDETKNCEWKSTRRTGTKCRYNGSSFFASSEDLFDSEDYDFDEESGDAVDFYDDEDSGDLDYYYEGEDSEDTDWDGDSEDYEWEM